MPDEASAAKTADKLWFYIDEEGARGFGHVGIVFAYSDGSAERFYQSAVNPQDKLWRLVILKQPVKVIRREIQNFRYIYQLIDSKECFCVHTRYGDAVRARVDEYIRKNAPYSTFSNNCAHFIHYILKPAKDIKSRRHFIPKKYYALLRQLNNQNKRRRKRVKPAKS